MTPAQRTPDEADLPEGKTCGDCLFWLHKCVWLISSKRESDRQCDWAPSRFRPIETDDNLSGGEPSTANVARDQVEQLEARMRRGSEP